MDERLTGLFSEKDLNKLKNANILLVGVGGVGSVCFEVLMRSLIGNITIIDFDIFEKSNFNRQIYATNNSINQKKVEITKNKGLEINPNCNITALDMYLDIDTKLDYENYDYIIDACDSVKAKANLIINANKHGIKVISCLGVGNRLDSTLLTISTLKASLKDPLGKKLNYTLKKSGYEGDVTVVSSLEKAIKLTPVSSYMPVSATAGILLADYVIKDITYEDK